MITWYRSLDRVKLSVAELAKQAGLYDSEVNVTPLLEQLLTAGKQVIMLLYE